MIDPSSFNTRHTAARHRRELAEALAMLVALGLLVVCAWVISCPL